MRLCKKQLIKRCVHHHYQHNHPLCSDHIGTNCDSLDGHCTFLQLVFDVAKLSHPRTQLLFHNLSKLNDHGDVELLIQKLIYRLQNGGE